VSATDWAVVRRAAALRRDVPGLGLFEAVEWARELVAQARRLEHEREVQAAHPEEYRDA
jgi:hypothetical protein